MPQGRTGELTHPPPWGAATRLLYIMILYMTYINVYIIILYHIIIYQYKNLRSDAFGALWESLRGLGVWGVWGLLVFIGSLWAFFQYLGP